MRLRVLNTETGKYVPNVEAIKLDHLGGGRPFTYVAGGKEWAFGPGAKLVVEPEPADKI